MRKNKYDSEENDSENEHVDERWLISYADMMTLLFGLFVMLYAMAPTQMKHEEAEKVKQSLNDNFAAPRATPPKITGDQLHDPSRNETGTKGPIEGERPGKIAAKEEPVDGLNPDATTRGRLETPGARATASNAKDPDEESEELEKQLNAIQKKAAAVEKELTAAKVESASMKQQVDQDKQKIADLESQLNSLKEELKQKAAGPLAGDGENKRSFISTIIQWETEKHDVDMVLVHPNGKRYSYKRRQYAGMTGNFILDSRQGPGMEVWQDAMLTAGRYELQVKLYNDYGNHKPAIVKGSILTVKGRMDLPTVELTMKSHPEATYIFNVDPEGLVTLESK